MPGIYLPTALLLIFLAGTAGHAQPSPVTWSARPELRIGNESDVNYTFESVSNILVGANGDMTVVDARGHVLRRFDAFGKHLKNVGRRGNGPGELQTIKAAGMLGDTLWISDGQLNRITLFALDGRVLKTLTLTYDPINSAFGSAAPSAMMDDGLAIATPELLANLFLSSERPLRPLARLDRRNNVRDTAAQIPLGRPVMMFGPNAVFAFQPFNDGALWRANSNGKFIVLVDRSVVRSSSPSYRVQKIGSGNVTGFDTRIAYKARRIETEDIDSVVAVGNKKLTEPGPPTQQNAQKIRAALFVPDHWPAVNSVVAGLDGTTWLECEPVGLSNVRWRVLDLTGKVIAQVELPRAIRVLQADRTHIWAAESLDDVPTVVRWIIAKNP